MSDARNMGISGEAARLLKKVADEQGISLDEAMSLAVAGLYELHQAGAFKRPLERHGEGSE